MSAGDVPRLIQYALTKTNPKGDDLIMNNSTNQAMEMNQGAPIQKTPLSFNCYDPNTGRTWTEDSTGRRISRRPDMTGSQLVAINSMRIQLGLPTLSNHNVKMMSVDSASRMQDDLRFFIDQYRIIAMEKERIEQEHAHQIEVLMEQLDSALKDPKVGAEIAKQRQYESTKREMKQ